MTTAERTGGSVDLDWRRPHPFTVLVEIGRAFRSVLIPLLVLRGNVLNGGTVIELALVALPLGAALARWYTTRYAVDVHSLHHHYGLLWRKRQVLPRANIQNVTTRAGPVARFASVLELQVSDASATGFISIRYVSLDEADRLATLLRSSIVHRPDPEAAATPAADPGDVPDDPPPVEDQVVEGPSGPRVELDALVEPTIGDLIRIEATSLPALTLAAAAVIGPVAAAVAISTEPFQTSQSAGWAAPIVAAGFVVPLLVAAFQVAARVLLIGGFRLTADPDRLRIRVGLVTESRVTARRERVQLIRVLRQAPHRRLGLERVEYETADLEAGSETPATSYLSPTASTGGWIPLAVETFGHLDLVESELQPVSPLTRRRVFIRFVVAALALAAAVTPLSPLAAVAALTTLIVGGQWYSRRRFEIIGWAMSADQILIRSGVILQSLTLARISKIQALRLRASYFQRRLGLTTLYLSTAGRGSHGLVSLPDLPVDQAEDLLRVLASQAAMTPIADTL